MERTACDCVFGDINPSVCSASQDSSVVMVFWLMTTRTPQPLTYCLTALKYVAGNKSTLYCIILYSVTLPDLGQLNSTCHEKFWACLELCDWVTENWWFFGWNLSWVGSDASDQLLLPLLGVRHINVMTFDLWMLSVLETLYVVAIISFISHNAFHHLCFISSDDPWPFTFDFRMFSSICSILLKAVKLWHISCLSIMWPWPLDLKKGHQLLATLAIFTSVSAF